MPKLVELAKPYIPLLPPSAIRYLSKILGSDTRVLEMGSGASTLWFASRGCNVTSLEHDAGWARYIGKLADQEGYDVDLRIVEKECFPRAVADCDGAFDLVFLDCWSKIRARCIQPAMAKVESSSWLLVDDTQWVSLSSAFALLDEWTSRDFFGVVNRNGDVISKQDVRMLYPRVKVEITRCTFWQKP